MTKRKLIRLSFVLYLAVVAYLCFAPSSGLPDFHPAFEFIQMDKLVHFLMFFPFPLLCWFSFESWCGISAKTCSRVILVFLAGCAVAAFTEIMQSFLPYRDADSFDFLADSCALFTSSLILLVLIVIKSKKYENR